MLKYFTPYINACTFLTDAKNTSNVLLMSLFPTLRILDAALCIFLWRGKPFCWHLLFKWQAHTHTKQREEGNSSKMYWSIRRICCVLARWFPNIHSFPKAGKHLLIFRADCPHTKCILDQRMLCNCMLIYLKQGRTL